MIGREAILNESYASRENLGVGDEVTLGGKTFTVVGIAETPLGGQSSDVYVKLAQLQKLSDRVGRVNTVYVRAASGDDVAAVASSIEKTVDGASVTTAADLADRVSGTLVDAKNLAGSLGKALMIVGLLSAFLIASLLTLSSVTKRVRELGTLKALGWSQGLVVRQVTGESLLQGLLGGAVGVVLGLVGAFVITAIGPTLEATVGAAADQGPRFVRAVRPGCRGVVGDGGGARCAGQPDHRPVGDRARAARGSRRRSGRKPARLSSPPCRRPPPHRLTRSQSMTATTTAAVYELRNVSRTYSLGGANVNAVRDVDLALEGGESVAVVGPSGSGKTTLLQLLGALDRPSWARSSSRVGTSGVSETATSRSSGSRCSASCSSSST